MLTREALAFSELGQLWREVNGSADFASPVTDPEVVGYVTTVVRSMIRERNLVVGEITVDGDTFTGVAQAKVSPRLTKRFEFEISPDSKTFGAINADEIEAFSEVVEFKGTRSGKTLNCKVSQCGGRCLKGGEKCRQTMSSDERKAHDKALKKVGTVETSLAKKRREMKESREKEAAAAKVSTKKPDETPVKSKSKKTTNTSSETQAKRKPSPKDEEKPPKKTSNPKESSLDASKKAKPPSKQLLLEETEKFLSNYSQKAAESEKDGSVGGPRQRIVEAHRIIKEGSFPKMTPSEQSDFFETMNNAGGSRYNGGSNNPALISNIAALQQEHLYGSLNSSQKTALVKEVLKNNFGDIPSEFRDAKNPRIQGIAKDMMERKEQIESPPAKNLNKGSKERNRFKWIDKQINNPDIPESAKKLLRTMPVGMARPFPVGGSRTSQRAWDEWAKYALVQAGLDYD
jgi:hypothetical protein